MLRTMTPETRVGAARLARLALALALAGPPCAAASLAVVGLAQLGRENWTRDVGLAGNWVRDIVKGSDGFLWVATAGGLSRFDGRTFVNFTAASEPEMPSNSIAALATGADGRLWIGLEHGGVRRVENRRVHREPALDGLPPVPVRALLEGADGALWIGTEVGLWRWSATGLERLAPSAGSRSPASTVWPSTAPAGSGCRATRVWCGCASPTSTAGRVARSARSRSRSSRRATGCATGSATAGAVPPSRRLPTAR